MRKDNDIALVRASALSGIEDYTQRNDLRVDRILERSEIGLESLGNPENSIGLSNFLSFWEVLSSEANDENLGIKFGIGFDPLDLGLMAYSVVNSPDLKSGLQELSRLLPLHQDNTMLTLVDGEGQCGFEYQLIGADPGVVRQDAELSIGMAIQFCRALLDSKWTPQEIHFQHNKPRNWREKEALFQVPIYFGQPTNGVYFESSDLLRKNPAADSNLLKFIRPILDERLRSEKAKPDLLERVEYEVGRNISESSLSIKSVSRGLGIGYRTLQRRLSEEGVNFSDLVDTVKKARADSLIKDKSMTVTDVSYMLGYSDSSAFNRAFKRWYGVAPRDYRNQHI